MKWNPQNEKGRATWRDAAAGTNRPNHSVEVNGGVLRLNALVLMRQRRAALDDLLRRAVTALESIATSLRAGGGHAR